jgi:hypothetical protein
MKLKYYFSICRSPRVFLTSLITHDLSIICCPSNVHAVLDFILNDVTIKLMKSYSSGVKHKSTGDHNGHICPC